jgi:hypothetical protein
VGTSGYCASRVVLPEPSTLSWPLCQGCVMSPMLTMTI